MPSTSPCVLAIGLDPGEPTWVEWWIRDGSMPNVARISCAGTFGQLRSNGSVFPDSPWPTFSTGSGPGAHGHPDFSAHHAVQTADVDWSAPLWDGS